MGFCFLAASPALPLLTQTFASYWVSAKHLTATEINLQCSHADPARIQPKGQQKAKI